MRNLSKLIIAVLLLNLTNSGATFASAENPVIDEGWVSPDWPIKGKLNLTFQDKTRGVGSPFLIQNEKVCSSLSDIRCSDPNAFYEYFTRLSKCENFSQMDCIETITANLDSKTVIGEFVAQFPTKIITPYSSDESLQLPKANNGGIWEFPSISNTAGDKYFVNVSMGGVKTKNDKKFVANFLSASIFGAEIVPIKLRMGRDGVPDDGSSYVLETTRPDGTPTLGAIGIYGPYEDEPLNCVMSGEGKCVNRKALPKNIKFELNLRLSNSPSGWFHGRISDPNILIKSLEEISGVSLSISGGSMDIPAIGFSKPWEQVDKTLQNKYLSGGFGPWTGCRWCSTNPLEATTTSQPPSYGDEAIAELTSWLPFISDRSSADINTWSVRTLDNSEMKGANKCFTKTAQLNGIVTSNSTVYSAGPPKFDGSSLNYQVAAPHLMSNGTIKRGAYTLVIRSDVARCVYGFSAAPIKASISIVNDEGVNTLATTTVSEKDNWIKLSAYNFTYSSPVIKVKLSQTKNQKYSISCFKGKVIKKVTSTKPKCPVGFKLKTN